MRFVECKPNSELTADVIEQIAALKSTFWPYPIESQIAWLRERTSPDDKHFMIWDGDQMAAYLRLVWRKTISGTRIGGLSTVVTHPDRQKQGLGKTIVMAASEKIVAAKCGGLLCCSTGNVQLYRACKWRECGAKIQNQDGKPFFVDQNILCIGPFNGGATTTILGDRY